MTDRQPLNRFTVLSSCNVDAVREALSQAYFDVTFAPREPYNSFDAKLNAVPLASGIQLSSLAMGTGFDISCPEVSGVYDFSMLLEGVGQAKVGRETCDVSRKSGVIVSPSRPVQLAGITASTGLGINITADVLERRLTALTGQELHEPLEFDPCMQLEGPVGGVWRFALYVANEINHDAGLHSNALLMNQFSETLLNSLLLTQPHNYSALLNRLGRSSGPKYVRLAEDYLESHCDEPVTVEQLAQIAGVSVSALYAGFKRHRAYTPMQFLKRARLRRAREQLLAAAEGTTVREVALRWGFSHLGRFSADYQQMFGESPSKTLRHCDRYSR